MKKIRPSENMTGTSTAILQQFRNLAGHYVDACSVTADFTLFARSSVLSWKIMPKKAGIIETDSWYLGVNCLILFHCVSLSQVTGLSLDCEVNFVDNKEAGPGSRKSIDGCVMMCQSFQNLWSFKLGRWRHVESSYHILSDFWSNFSELILTGSTALGRAWWYSGRPR